MIIIDITSIIFKHVWMDNDEFMKIDNNNSYTVVLQHVMLPIGVILVPLKFVVPC